MAVDLERSFLGPFYERERLIDCLLCLDTSLAISNIMYSFVTNLKLIYRKY